MVDVNALVATALGLMVGLGVLLVIQGLRGRPVVATMTGFVPSARLEIAVVWVCGGLVLGLLVWAVTGWIVLAVVLGGLVVSGPSMTGGRHERADFVARSEAVAAWAEMIRDTMAAAAGLTQALVASAAHAPEPIQEEVTRFAERLERMPLPDALGRLGDELHHPSADLIVAALTTAARMEARELAPLLSRLATSIREDVRMRLRVEVGRARIRTSARIIVTTTGATIGFMFVFSRNLLEAYDTATGQVWLAVVIAVFAAGAALMRSYGRIDVPERFSARRPGPTGTGEPGSS